MKDGSIVKVHLLDTSGQEIYKSINETYYKKADCCLLVYDITNRKSFDECKDYYNKNLIEKCKKDLEDQRVISPEEGAGLALENDYIFMETSCLKNSNVASAFETLIELTNIEEKRKQNKNIQINNNNSNRRNACRC